MSEGGGSKRRSREAMLLSSFSSFSHSNPLSISIRISHLFWSRSSCTLTSVCAPGHTARASATASIASSLADRTLVLSPLLLFGAAAAAAAVVLGPTAAAARAGAGDSVPGIGRGRASENRTRGGNRKKSPSGASSIALFKERDREEENEGWKKKKKRRLAFLPRPFLPLSFFPIPLPSRDSEFRSPAPF